MSTKDPVLHRRVWGAWFFQPSRSGESNKSPLPPKLGPPRSCLTFLKREATSAAIRAALGPHRVGDIKREATSFHDPILGRCWWPPLVQESDSAGPVSATKRCDRGDGRGRHNGWHTWDQQPSSHWAPFFVDFTGIMVVQKCGLLVLHQFTCLHDVHPASLNGSMFGSLQFQSRRAIQYVVVSELPTFGFPAMTPVLLQAPLAPHSPLAMTVSPLQRFLDKHRPHVQLRATRKEVHSAQSKVLPAIQVGVGSFHGRKFLSGGTKWDTPQRNLEHMTQTDSAPLGQHVWFFGVRTHPTPPPHRPAKLLCHGRKSDEA